METNEISVCAKLVSPDMKDPTEQTGNQHDDQAVNNYMSSISDQSINNYMGSIGDQAVNNYMGSIGDQAVNNYMGSISDQAVNTWAVLVISRLMNTGVVFISKFKMVVASWEVVGIKQITSI